MIIISVAVNIFNYNVCFINVYTMYVNKIDHFHSAKEFPSFTSKAVISCLLDRKNRKCEICINLNV